MRTRRLFVPIALGLGLALLWVVGSHALSGATAPAPSEAAQAAGGAIYYVDRNVATDTTTGLMWTQAFTNVQDALDVAASGDEIWVAEGVYTPTSDIGPAATFQLVSGVALYGGFAGTETVRSERDWEANVTVLSGDLEGDDMTDGNGVVTDTENISGTNACHVVTGSGVTETAVLDGFTITAGDASGSDPDDQGGGMYNNNGSPTVRNVTFSGNNASLYGGGVLNDNDSSPSFERTAFIGNSADQGGGGMYNWHGSSPILTNAIFSRNFSGSRGGALYNNVDSSPKLINVTISGNEVAGEGGSALRNYDNSSPILTNCVAYTNVRIINATFVVIDLDQISNGSPAESPPSTPTISYSDIQNSGGSGGGWNDNFGSDGGDNIDADPLFVDEKDGDLRLTAGSPCIDIGTDASVDVDFEGQSRPWGTGIDMGADELVGCYDVAEPYDGVDAIDIQTIAGLWRQSADHPPYDVDGDGMTTIIEVMKAVAHWGQTCP